MDDGRNDEFDTQKVYKVGRFQVQGRTLSQLTATRSGVSACISPVDGAELSSLTVRDTSGVHELLYRGNDWRRVAGWPGRAPWLWPVAGRTYGRADDAGEPLRESVHHWRYRDQILPMPHHGFARSKSWQTRLARADESGAYVSADYQSNGDDHALYPFDYRLDMAIAIQGSTVILTMRVAAGDKNDHPMPFTIGQHLTYDLSSWWGSDWLSGTILGTGRLGWGFDSLKLAAEPQTLPPTPMMLSDRLLQDCMIPAIPGKSLQLVSLGGTKRIDLSFTVSDLPSDDATLWVTHCDPAGRFFCLEPWVGWPNGINSSHGRIELDPGEVWSMVLQMDIAALDLDSPGGGQSSSKVQANPAHGDLVSIQDKPKNTLKQRVME